MAEIRFKNLPNLLSSMEKKGWIIDSFLFKYKKEDYVVILKLYSDAERKPSKHAKVKLEFIRANNINESIHAYADLKIFLRFFRDIYQMKSMRKSMA